MDIHLKLSAPHVSLAWATHTQKLFKNQTCATINTHTTACHELPTRWTKLKAYHAIMSRGKINMLGLYKKKIYIYVKLVRGTKLLKHTTRRNVMPSMLGRVTLRTGSLRTSNSPHSEEVLTLNHVKAMNTEMMQVEEL